MGWISNKTKERGCSDSAKSLGAVEGCRCQERTGTNIDYFSPCLSAGLGSHVRFKYPWLNDHERWVPASCIGFADKSRGHF
jgi:hypothetical protein